MKKKVIMVIVLLGLVSGCIPVPDPNTGETKYKPDPNIVSAVEKTIEVAIGVGTATTPLLPWMAPIVALAAGAYATYKRQKPKLVAAETSAAKAHSVTEALVNVLEDFKEQEPEKWKKLKALMSDYVGTETENVIRALRGLPPKE